MKAREEKSQSRRSIVRHRAKDTKTYFWAHGQLIDDGVVGAEMSPGHQVILLELGVEADIAHELRAAHGTRRERRAIPVNESEEQTPPEEPKKRRENSFLGTERVVGRSKRWTPFILDKCWSSFISIKASDFPCDPR